MATALPLPITSYYAAERAGDFNAMAGCFSPDGTLRDEGQLQTGHAAIAAWMADAKRRYGHKTEVLDVEERDGSYVVSVRVAGDFPNSPVTLDQRFRLEDGRIRRLEIG